MPQNGELVSPSATELDKQPYVQPGVATLPETAIDYDNEKVVFSFIDYNKNKCEIGKLTNREPRDLTEMLKRVNQTLTKHLPHFQQSSVECSTVHRSGNYVTLYDDIPADAELMEIKYNKQGRIFGYITKNIFNITVIKKKHL